MKYTHGRDWVDIVGAADLPMRDLDALYTADTETAFAIAAGLVRDWQITVRGQPVAAIAVAEDGARRLDVFGLSLRQWDWLRDCILKAARDEALDPEV